MAHRTRISSVSAPTLRSESQLSDVAPLLLVDKRGWGSDMERVRSLAGRCPVHGLGVNAVVERSSPQRRQRPVSEVLLIERATAMDPHHRGRGP